MRYELTGYEWAAIKATCRNSTMTLSECWNWQTRHSNVPLFWLSTTLRRTRHIVSLPPWAGRTMERHFLGRVKLGLSHSPRM